MAAKTADQVAAAVGKILTGMTEHLLRLEKNSSATTLAATRKLWQAQMAEIKEVDVHAMLTRAPFRSILPTPPTTPPATNTLPPTPPLPWKAVSSPGQIVFSFFQSAAHHNGTLAGVAVQKYQYRVLPSATWVDITTIGGGAIPGNVMGLPTLTEIGSITPDPVATRLGADWQMAFNGTGEVMATRSQLHWPWTTGKVVSVDLDSFSSSDSTFPADYGGAGAVISKDLVVGGIAVVVYFTLAGGSRRCYCKFNTVSGGAVSEFFIDGNGAFGTLLLVPNGANVEAWKLQSGVLEMVPSTDANAMVTPLGASGYAGIVGNALSTTVATAIYKNIAIRPAQTIDIPVTTTSDTTVEIRAVNTDGIASAITSYTGTYVLSVAKRWRPGHGINRAILSSGDTEDAQKQDADRMRFENNFKHYHLIMRWREVNPTPGVFIWDRIHALKSYVNNRSATMPGGLFLPSGQFAQPKVIGTEFFFMKFGATDFTTGTQAVPQWIIDAGYTYITGTGAFADMRVPAVRNAYIDLMEAYGEEFDDDEETEFQTLTELAGQWRTDDYKEIVTAMATAMPKTNIFCANNWGPYPAEVYMRDLTAHMMANKCGPAAPDIEPFGAGPRSKETEGMLVHRAAGTIVSEYYNPTPQNYGSIDYRGVLPVHLQYQVPNHGYPPELIDYCQSQKVTHVSWGMRDDYSDPGLRAAAVIAAVNADPALHTVYPTGY